MSEERSAARHLTRLAGDLRELAERHRLGTLSYLLGLVVAEGVLQTKEREQVKAGDGPPKSSQSASGIPKASP